MGIKSKEGNIEISSEKMMKYIGKYDELSPGRGYPSMKKFCQLDKYEGQDKIIDYLNHGNVDMIRMTIPKDVFSGENIRMSYIGMNDGEYSWFNILSYYVKKYNLRLPEEFENKILNNEHH